VPQAPVRDSSNSRSPGDGQACASGAGPLADEARMRGRVFSKGKIRQFRDSGRRILATVLLPGDETTDG